ncbi:MAG: lipoprotein NlpD [Idiomarinaceae bacterium HL-53]|nr:MAG: lipoprotein NlpD [Idiomarinaceae bacterium HL-53]CUS49116.1 lipoprotein NlpD [Idiomarinaceae bacterium HL-53]
MNKKHNQFLISCGVVVFLSACMSPHTPAPVTQVYRGPSYHDYQQASWSADTYEVRPGDTLYSIAFRANMDMREITQLNNLQEPFTIFPGQVLKLKASGAGENADALVSQNRNNNTSGSQSNDLSPAVAATAEAEYGENVASEKDSAIQPITASSSRQERQIRSADLRWQWPSRGRVTSRFSAQAPSGQGIEFAGEHGDPVVAAEAGKIVYTGTALRGYGRLIIMKHNDDYITAYGHNDEILVQEQQWVEAGQQIATMGSSGRSDVRLRFEMRFRGNSINPENYLPRNR